MTAGAGVLHSEIPEQAQGTLRSFQISANLPAAYREMVSNEIPERRLPHGGVVRVIAGKVTIGQQSMQGLLPKMSTDAVFVDVQIVANEVLELSLETENRALVYAYQGGTELISSRQLAIYSDGKKLVLKAGPSGATFLVLSGNLLMSRWCNMAFL